MTTRWHKLLRYTSRKSPKSWNFSRSCRQYTGEKSAKDTQSPAISLGEPPQNFMRTRSQEDVSCFVFIGLSHELSSRGWDSSGRKFSCTVLPEPLGISAVQSLPLRIIKLCKLGLHPGRNVTISVSDETASFLFPY